MNIKIELEYIGTNYCGWQKQRNSLTVQQVLEDIIFKLTNEKVILIGSGRTDSGVHAKSQIANFTIQKKINLRGLKTNINKLLPNDIKIKKCNKVSNNFHSQFSSLQKTYLYKIKYKNDVNVFEKGKIFFYKSDLDIKKLKKISTFFLGEKDFVNFCKKGYSGESTIRKIESIKVFKKGLYIDIRITGNGFLRGMVRLIVGSMINFCKGNLKEEEITNALKYSSKPLPRNYSVPAEGLYLFKVKY